MVYYWGMDEIMDFLATQPYNRHIFDATRTSPFGYYATCSCGVVSPEYRGSHFEAWEDWVAHKEALKQ